MSTTPLNIPDAFATAQDYGEGSYSDYTPILTEEYANYIVRSIVRTVLAMPDGSVRRANIIGPVGTTLYATVLVSNFNRTGWDDDVFTDDAGSATELHESIQGQRRVTASIQFFKDGANVQASRLVQMLQGSTAQTVMTGYNVGLGSIGQVRNMTAVVNTVWEDRAGLDIDFYFVARTDQTVDTFFKFPFTIQNV